MNCAILGGSGFLGRELTRQLYKEAKRIVIFSRNEASQAKMKRTFPEYPDNIMRYMIGDVRDEKRLISALRNIDYVILAAAQKRIEVCEYDPVEAVKTNILGAINTVNACNIANVKKCILTSTDKACSPATHYGSSKLCAERIFIASNNLGKCRFSVVRYGNVEGSTGSVIPLWKKQIENNEPITITDKRMTRFWISLSDAAKFVLSKFDIMEGGEVFVPKLTSKSMTQLADELIGNYHNSGTLIPVKEIGIRPGEKLHEVLISEEDCRNCFDDGDYYTIYPSHHDWTKQFLIKGKKVKEGFIYCSNTTT